MFQNHHCGHKLPHYPQTQRLWLGRPWYLRVPELTPALTRQVWRPQGGSQVSKFSLQRPGRPAMFGCATAHCLALQEGVFGQSRCPIHPGGPPFQWPELDSLS